MRRTVLLLTVMAVGLMVVLGVAVRPTRVSRNTQPQGLRFRATLGEESKVELTLV
jgi:hypothetical protein